MKKLPTLSEAGIRTVSITEAHPGDLAFCHSKGFVGRAIRIAQKFISPRAFRKWNHIIMLIEPVKTDDVITDWKIIQAEERGVSWGLLSTVTPGGYYEIVPLTAFPSILSRGTAPYLVMVDPDTAIATMESLVGQKYGILTIASIVVNLLTPKWLAIDFRKQKTFICSASCTYSILSGGAIVNTDVYQITPSQVAQLASH